MSENFDNTLSSSSIAEIEIPSPKQGSVISPKIVAQRLINHRVKKIFDSADYYMEKESKKCIEQINQEKLNQEQELPTQVRRKPLISTMNTKKVLFDSADYFLAQAQLNKKPQRTFL